jgi:peptidoglycan hydrolase CwlO-like protein
MDTTTTILTLIGTVIATIGGKEAWSYYKERLRMKNNLIKYGSKSENSLQSEIRELLEGQIKELKEQVRALTARISSLEQEREVDKKRIGNQEVKIALLSERLAIRSRGRFTNDIDDKDGIH